MLWSVIKIFTGILVSIINSLFNQWKVLHAIQLMYWHWSTYHYPWPVVDSGSDFSNYNGWTFYVTLKSRNERFFLKGWWVLEQKFFWNRILIPQSMTISIRASPVFDQTKITIDSKLKAWYYPKKCSHQEQFAFKLSGFNLRVKFQVRSPHWRFYNVEQRGLIKNYWLVSITF